MNLPDDPRELFEDDGLENVKIVGCNVGECHVTLHLEGGYPAGTFAVQIGCSASEVYKGDEIVDVKPFLTFTYDEPRGAGADPYNRPDPGKHPEAWTE